MKQIQTHERAILSLDEIPRSNGRKRPVTKSHSQKVHKYDPKIENEKKLVQQIPKKRIQVRIDLTLEFGFEVASIPRWNQPYTSGRGNNLGNRARALVRALGPYDCSPFVSNNLHIQLVRNVLLLFDSSLGKQHGNAGQRNHSPWAPQQLEDGGIRGLEATNRS